jgi:hypothetical protein
MVRDIVFAIMASLAKIERQKITEARRLLRFTGDSALEGRIRNSWSQVSEETSGRTSWAEP